MRNRFYLLALSIILVFGNVACKERDEVTDFVVEYYSEKKVEFDKDLEYCVLLPEVGCEGCIASGVDFFQRNKTFFSNSQRKNMIIFTSINSMKMLYRTLGISSLKDYYCCLDVDNNYLILDNNSIYPLVLYLKNGVILKAEYQSPYSNDVLGKLEEKLAI